MIARLDPNSYSPDVSKNVIENSSGKSSLVVVTGKSEIVGAYHLLIPLVDAEPTL
jgi:hypothetical protein